MNGVRSRFLPAKEARVGLLLRAVRGEDTQDAEVGGIVTLHTGHGVRQREFSADIEVR
jgi:hypothetical protein